MVQSGLHMLAVNTPWLVAIVIAFIIGMEVQNQLGRRRRRKWANGKAAKAPAGGKKWQPRLVPTEKPFDPAQQLREVETATFTRRRILNAAETRLLQVIDRAVAEAGIEWRVMAQVALGEILASPSESAFRAINSKRVDLLIVGPEGDPLHAIEYQGSGHHLGPAATRDAVKKEALRKAGISYIEVLSGDTPAEVHRMILKLARA